MRHLGLPDWHKRRHPRRARRHRTARSPAPRRPRRDVATADRRRPPGRSRPCRWIADRRRGRRRGARRATHRIAPLARLVRRPRPLRWRRVAPPSCGRAGARCGGACATVGAEPTPWLRPAGRELLVAGLDDAERDAAAVVRGERAPGAPPAHPGARRRATGGSSPSGHDVDVSSPLLHPDVVARARPTKAACSGAATARRCCGELVPDLLPDDVLARTSKATFTAATWGDHTREFAARWDGSGVDPDLVDAEELRRAGSPSTGTRSTAALLQRHGWRAASSPARIVDGQSLTLRSTQRLTALSTTPTRRTCVEHGFRHQCRRRTTTPGGRQWQLRDPGDHRARFGR